MKLKCQDHERRVVVLESGTVVHRNGDGSRCNTFALTIGTRFIPPLQGQHFKDKIKNRNNRRDGYEARRLSGKAFTPSGYWDDFDNLA